MGWEKILAQGSRFHVVRGFIRSLKTIAITINLAFPLLSGLLVFDANLPRLLAAGSASPIDLYFHNDSSSPFVGGFIRTILTLNTTQTWKSSIEGVNNFTSRLTLDYYLHPDLAGNFTINATVWLHPWLVGSGTGGSAARGSFTIALYDISSSGHLAVGSSASSGSESIPFGATASQSADVNAAPSNAPLKFTMSPYTFLQGHSILIHIEILPESVGTILSFYYDNQVTPSHVTLYASTIVAVANIWSESATGFKTMVFPTQTSNPQIGFYANVTDPLGGYDINASTIGDTYARVALDLITPQASVVLFQERMSLLSGGQTSLQNLFRLNFSFTSRSGLWGYDVIATDNSGNQAIRISYVLFGSDGPPPFVISTGQGVLILALILGGAIILYLKRRRERSKPNPWGVWKPSVPAPRGTWWRE